MLALSHWVWIGSAVAVCGRHTELLCGHSVWRPNPPAGYSPVCHFAERATTEATSAELVAVREVGWEVRTVLLLSVSVLRHSFTIEQEGDVHILRNPTDMVRIFDNEGCEGGKKVSFWAPIPPKPPGVTGRYVAMGHLCSPHVRERYRPSLASIACILTDFVLPCPVGTIAVLFYQL